MASALQKLRAVHLYRHSLKTMLSWAVRREVFYVEVSAHELGAASPGSAGRRGGGRTRHMLRCLHAGPLHFLLQQEKIRAEFDQLNQLVSCLHLCFCALGCRLRLCFCAPPCSARAYVM